MRESSPPDAIDVYKRQPLIVSHQKSDNPYLARWLKQDISKLNIVATYNLVFNASLLVDEGLGYALTLDKLINTEESNLCFRPLYPQLDAAACIVWKRYQVFSKAADKYMQQLKYTFALS